MREIFNWFIGLHWIWYVVIIFGIVSFSLLWKYRGFKKLVYKSVCFAENLIVGNKRGQERFDFVVRQIYLYIPFSLRWLLDEKRIGDIIEWGVRKMKKGLERKLERDGKD